ncbi:MAG TPA: phage tail sheath subtilisin-like domain-containing protein [Kofleriaceae bacterium]|nr:phage tail sheath subtilisin-like domain-containing protein [Kofleriaceae bacterium]
MANPTYPGVYVEEVSSGIRPIESASTSTAAFVGLSEMGRDDDAIKVTSWTEFRRLFGNFIPDAFLPASVFQFFNNGGSQAYILRVTRSDAALASATVANRASPATAGVKFSAASKGAWGNTIFLEIANGSVDPFNEVKVTVRKQDQADVIAPNFADQPPLEVHDNLSLDASAANFIETMIARNSGYITAQVVSANVALQRGNARSGIAPTLPLTDKRSFQISLDGDGFQQVTLDAALAPSTDLAAIATEITTRVRALGATKKKSSTPAEAFSAFTCTVETTPTGDRLLMQSGTNVAAGVASAASSVAIQDASANNAAPQLKLGAHGGSSEDALAVRRPALAATVQLGDNAVDATVVAVALGSDGTAALTETAFDAAFHRLDNKTDVSLLAVPEFPTDVMMSLGMAYCENRPLRDMFYIGALRDFEDTVAEAQQFRALLTKPNSYGALYFPWVKTLDPTGASSQPILLPPVGYIAGLYARIDANRGVWKAPAGTEASLSGVVGLATDLSDVQQGSLNQIGVNCIRRFATAGIVSWGGRTVASDPEFKYVPVRRTAIMLRVSLYYGLQWTVFEPNDEGLWSQIRLNVNAFMMTLFRRGAFQGSSPSAAFFVKCDGETTTQADIDLGIVNVLVGFAPLKPAEFVIVKISQKAGQSS